MYDLILKNCNIVNENTIIESDIAIKNNRIELIANSIDSEAKNIEDVNGRFVIPGLIDDQVHFREPGLTHKGDIATESKAGLAGGVTSYFEMPNVNPTTTTNENLTKKFELASTRSLSNYSFHLGGSNTNIEEIKQVDINQAAALKVFMGASTGEMLVDSIDALDDIFHYSPLTVVTHCEDPQRVKDNEKLFSDKYGLEIWLPAIFLLVIVLPELILTTIKYPLFVDKYILLEPTIKPVGNKFFIFLFFIWSKIYVLLITSPVSLSKITK